MKKDSWQEDDYKLMRQYISYHKIPERLLLNCSDRFNLSLLMCSYQIPEKILYYFISISEYELVDPFILNQNFSKSFFLDNFNYFLNRIKENNYLQSLLFNLTPYHYLQLKSHQPWFDELNINHAQLQLDLASINVKVKINIPKNILTSLNYLLYELL